MVFDIFLQEQLLNYIAKNNKFINKTKNKIKARQHG